MSKNLRSRISKILASIILLAPTGLNLMPNAGNTVFAMDDMDDEEPLPTADLFLLADKDLEKKKKIELEGYPSDDDSDKDEINKELQAKIKKGDKGIELREEIIEIKIETDEQLKKEREKQLKKENIEKLEQELTKKMEKKDGEFLKAMRNKLYNEENKRALKRKLDQEKLEQEKQAREKQERLAQETWKKQERERLAQEAREKQERERLAQEAREKQEQAESRRRKLKIIWGVGASLAVVTIGGVMYIIPWWNVEDVVNSNEYDFDFEEDDNSQDKIHYLNN